MNSEERYHREIWLCGKTLTLSNLYVRYITPKVLIESISESFHTQ